MFSTCPQSKSTMQRVATTICAVGVLLSLLAASCETRRPLLRKPRDASTTGCYFIVLKDKATEEEMQELMTRVARLSDGGKVYGEVHKVTKAFTVKLSPYALELVRNMPAVDYIEEEGFAVGDQLPWQLDRVDQRSLPLDLTYGPIGDGSGAYIYILDTGIHYEHEEFENRAKYGGYDPVDEHFVRNDLVDDYERLYGRDCHGHGTHVASLAGGKTFGTAKKVSLYSVRVLACNNAAPWSVVLDGLDYVMRNAPLLKRPVIVSMSLSGDYFRTVNDAVARLAASGIHIVTAAGNGKTDSCSRSPASSPHTINVGGTRIDDALYQVGPGTNFGSCVDVFAPGEKIEGADMKCINCSKLLSGTSMACPVVSGLAAIMLSRQPLLSPSELKSKLITESTKDRLDFTLIPDQYRDATPNRLVYIPGSCGGSVFLRNHAVITSPNYPQNYPPNLDCEWSIEGDEDERIRFDLTDLRLESHYDILRIYNGPCCNKSSFVQEMTGNQGSRSFTYRTSSNMLCLQLETDGIHSAAGFNATYTRFYAGTDIKVPEEVELPTVPPSTPLAAADIYCIISLSPRQARALTGALVDNGYHVLWATSYATGPTHKPYFDVILTNSTQVDTRGYIDISFSLLNRTIHEMRGEGYSVRSIADRRRGVNPKTPFYSAVFVRNPEVIETEVFLRDNITAYSSRLARMKADSYRLISHSFCEIQGQVEATSVYIRDKRVVHNISVGRMPRWESYYNLSFLRFTEITLRHGEDKLFPANVEVNVFGGESRFAVIYEEQLDDRRGTWFRWGVDTDATRETMEQEKARWQPVLTTSYNYLGKVNHFIEFQRRQYFT